MVLTKLDRALPPGLPFPPPRTWYGRVTVRDGRTCITKSKSRLAATGTDDSGSFMPQNPTHGLPYPTPQYYVGGGPWPTRVSRGTYRDLPSRSPSNNRLCLVRWGSPPLGWEEGRVSDGLDRRVSPNLRPFTLYEDPVDHYSVSRPPGVPTSLPSRPWWASGPETGDPIQRENPTPNTPDHRKVSGTG